MTRGSLTVVGTGIQLGTHLTAETRAHLERADEVLHLVTEPATRAWIERLNGRVRSLHPLYRAGRDRAAIYEDIVETVLQAVRSGRSVCLALYGHPGVFVEPGHDVVRRAREEGFPARMLPAVSAEDCLYADLGVDPAVGCHSYEATDFLVHGRSVDTSVALILWQVTLIGRSEAVSEPVRAGLHVLADRLLRDYPPEHEVVLYEASAYPVADASIVAVPLGGLAEAPLRPLATLYVPPASAAKVDAEMVARLRASAQA